MCFSKVIILSLRASSLSRTMLLKEKLHTEVSRKEPEMLEPELCTDLRSNR